MSNFKGIFRSFITPPNNFNALMKKQIILKGYYEYYNFSFKKYINFLISITL